MTRHPTGEEGERPVEYVVLSDVHLTEVEVSPIPGWWPYKSPSARQDDLLVDFLGFLERKRPAAFARTHVVLNGDTWDFDSVYSAPADADAPPEGMPTTVAGSVWKARRLVRDHPRFVAGLARFLARGNQVTFVLGNHDREFAFPEVQEVLLRALAAAAPPGCGGRVADSVAFEPWFFYVPGVMFVEHGQQYDTTCSYRDVLHPFIEPDRRHDRELEASLGSVIGRQVLSRLGSFDPFDDASFLKSFPGYIRHALDHYFPKRPFLTVYIRSAFRVLRIVRARRRRALAAALDREDAYRSYAAGKGVDGDFVAMLRRLSSAPIADRLRHLAHELWVDRFLLVFATLAILLVGVLNAESWFQGLLMLALLPLVAFALRALGRGSMALEERGRWGLVAEQVAGRLGVPIVAFGHSHRPERRPLRNGGRYYNLGTWAPVGDPEQGVGLLRSRRFLVVRSRGPGRTWVAFQRWGHDGTAPF
ncbi:MAG: hypothetical protein ACQEXJ_01385 [Myxococcota bacterium]